jgi:hypothetical protein
MEDSDNFLHWRLFESLAPAAQNLREFDGRILHPLVSFLRASHEQKMFTLRQALVTIFVIEAEANKAHDATIL